MSDMQWVMANVGVGVLCVAAQIAMYLWCRRENRRHLEELTKRIRGRR